MWAQQSIHNVCSLSTSHSTYISSMSAPLEEIDSVCIHWFSDVVNKFKTHIEQLTAQITLHTWAPPAADWPELCCVKYSEPLYLHIYLQR